MTRYGQQIVMRHDFNRSMTPASIAIYLATRDFGPASTRRRQHEVSFLQVIILALFSNFAVAQDAVVEESRVFGECSPVYAAAQDGLNLYRQPDLRSQRVQLRYKKGWRIPTDKRRGITRVIKTGELRVLKPDERLRCTQPPTEGPAELIVGEIVDYLYYLGEGMGRVQFRGAVCSSQVVEDFEVYETIAAPEVQVWLRVFFADGLSPGWLFFDGTQIVVSDVVC